MTHEERDERWRAAHHTAVHLTGNRSPDTTLLTIGIMLVEAISPPQPKAMPKPKPLAFASEDYADEWEDLKP